MTPIELDAQLDAAARLSPADAEFRCLDCHIEPYGNGWAVIRTDATGGRTFIGTRDSQHQAEMLACLHAGPRMSDCLIT